MVGLTGQDAGEMLGLRKCSAGSLSLRISLDKDMASPASVPDPEC